MKYSSKVVRVSLVLISLFLFFICLELVLRMFYGKYELASNWTSQEEFTPDSQLIYGGAKNKDFVDRTDEYTQHVVTNSLGFRDREIRKKKNNTHRILVVGDSFTFGHGISSNDKTYPRQLEKYIQDKTDTTLENVEVYNLGIRGYSPDQEYRYIKNIINSLEPDLVIWTLNNPGDIYNTIHVSGWPTPSLYDVKGDQLIPLDARLNWLYFGKYVKLHSPPFIYKSYTFNLLVYALSQIQLFSRKPYLPMDKALDWAIAKLRLECMDVNKQFKNRSTQFVVVVLPYPEQFQKGQVWQTLSKKVDVLFMELRNKKIDIINVQNEMSKDEILHWKSFYFVTDYHPNERGTTLFASIVGRRIMKYLPLH